VAVPARQLS
jgi:hypothetical protein